MTARVQSAGRRRPPSARDLALRALLAVEEGGRANIVVPQLLDASGLAKRDRAFVTELVYGTVRMQRACDWLAGRHVHRELDPTVRCALRLGAYQLAFLRTPPHAAVSSTVSEVDGPGRGLVNAVLRKVAGDVAGPGPVPWPDLPTALSYPDWIVARLTADLGAEAARAALAQMNQPASVTRRADGYIQDEASQKVAAYLAPEAGDRVLDVCAAPGGKATALGYGANVVVAADIDLTRSRVVASNVAGLGLTNVPVVVSDSTRPPFPLGAFDQVLVDAPCSGLGVLRRRPDARWRIQPGQVQRLTELQRRLIEAGIGLLRPGGLLVYSVCTLTNAETTEIDAWLAQAHPHLLSAASPGAPWEPVGRGWRLLPQTAGTDGMYVLGVRSPRVD